ncbi:MAG TPA: NAD(P)-dependent oxidoreductase [Solirubrobacteraceae bacterium]|nr:NAD(P)-dependent oxidoreductase [Solirubrobacteraceae bacterium]
MSDRPKTSGPVGLIGLGKMGQPMSAVLLAAGFDLVGYDPLEPARAALTVSGGTAAADASEVARSVHTLILMLPNSAAVEGVVEQLLDDMALTEGHLLIDMSSSEPLRTRALAEQLKAHGVDLIDAPVSGGVARAKTGKLTIMTGGDASLIDAGRPVLEALGTVFSVGPVGSGHAVKALNNLLSATHLMATAEAMRAGRELGLEADAMLAVFNTASGQSGSTLNKWPNFVLTETYNSGFALDLMCKDVRIATDLLRSLGTPSEVSLAIDDAWQHAMADLAGGADHTEVARWVDKRAATPAASA